MLPKSGKRSLIRRKSLGRVATFDPALPNELVERLWHEPASLIASGEMMRRTSLRRTVRLPWGGKVYVLKQYRPTWWHFLRQLPVRSSCAATFAATMKLIDAGIRTPRPLAYVENRWGALRRDSFLIYEYVEGVTLRTYLQGDGNGPRPLTEGFSRQLCDVWQRLVDLRASLNDSHMGNFIVGPAGRLWVIDLDKTRFHLTAYIANRHHERGWRQIIRSAGKCGTTILMPMPVARPATVPVSLLQVAEPQMAMNKAA